MNKKVLWGVIALVILALVIYFAMARRSSAPAETMNKVESSSNSQSSAQPEQTSAQPKSLKDLIALGTSQKCTFGTGASSGTMYISGGKARGDFSTTENGKVVASHMMMDGSYSYVWMDGQAQGFKTSLEASQTTSPTPSTGTGPKQGVDANEKMNYQCGAWLSDSSMFSLPAGVHFMDFSSMMKNVPNK